MTGDQTVAVERLGNSYIVEVTPLGAIFTFRDVSISGELRADVAVRHGTRHLFRTTTTLTLQGRDRVAKTAAEMDGQDGAAWRDATFAATEAVLDAEEALSGAVDLRYVKAAGPGGEMVVESFFPAANTGLIAPNEIGKTTIVRALMLSITTGLEIIPGLLPRVSGPVLYVVGEDPFDSFHARSLDEIGRGIGFDRRDAPHALEMFPTRGRPLYRLARSLSERAADCVAVFLDSHQSLLGPMGDGANVRDRDQRYWDAIDEIGKPSFTVGHPNRSDRQRWDSSDGSFAGSDVNQDRIRCRWMARYRDDDDPAMGMFRRLYTLDNQKWTHGPMFPSVSFAIERTQAYGSQDWTANFVATDALSREDGRRPAGRPATVFEETLDAWHRGIRTPKDLVAALPGLEYETAKKRIQNVRKHLASIGEE